MRDPRARLAHDLLKRAVEIESSRRSAFVEEQCNGDAALRDRVLALLRALTHSRDFLESPALGENVAKPAPAPMPAEKDIAGYRIVRIIGEGGMARVYEAIQQRPHRRVALKVMYRGITQPSAVQRFLFETEVLARLRHPNIAQIFEAGSFDDGAGGSTPFFAMEYIPDARPITLYADEEGLSLHQRLELCAVLCDAVQHGHQNGVIHRDLKPGNALVDSHGQLKVIDFGIARSTDPELAWITRHTDIGQLVGTLNYMSPEQCAGALDLDVRADVYSLGVMLYELLCGALPHDLTRVPVPEALRRVQRDAPPRPSTVKPELRGDLEAIILKAIDKEPDRRYHTAASLAADIHRFLRHETIEARSPTLFYQTRLFARRHRALVTSLAAVLLMLLASTIISWRFAYVASKELGLREQAELEAIAQRDAAVWRAYVANIAAAGAALRTNELSFARRNLREAPDIHRNWEWRLLNEATQRSSVTIEAHDDMVFGFDLSSNGAQIATGSRDGTIRIWSSTLGLLKAELTGHEHWIMSVSFSPDGTKLASGAYDETVRIWDLESQRELHALTGHRGNVMFVSFGPDNIVASAGADNQCFLWNADTGERIRDLADQPGGISGVRYANDRSLLMTWNNRGSLWLRSPDGSEVIRQLAGTGNIYCATISDDNRWVAIGGDDGVITLWDLGAPADNPPRELKTSQSLYSVRALAFSPDGATLATGHTDREIRYWTVATGEEQLRRSRGHEETVAGLSFTRDGSQLISASWDRTMRIWEFAGTGLIELVTTLRGHADSVINTRFSPDGSMVASSGSDGTVRLWDPELGTLLATLRGHRASVFALAFSHDGRRLASGSHDRTVRIWNATTGAQDAVLEGHDGHVWSVAFSPDDRLLASAGNDMVIRVWNLATGEIVQKLEGHTARVTSIAFSPDGTQLSSASRDHSVRLWDLTSGAPRFRMDGHTLDVYAVIFSADGTQLFSGGRDQTVRVWEADCGTCTAVLDGHGQNVTCLALNPQGDRLAAGSWFGEIVVWDVPSLDIVLSFKGHEEVIRSVAFDPTGRWLASASYDKTVRLYDELGQHARAALRSDTRRNYADAEPIAASLFEKLHDPPHVAAALDAGGQCDAALTPYVRKLVLKRVQEAESATSADQ